MAKKWSEVSGSDGFKALSPDQKDVARRQYFDEVVAPQVPAEAVDAAWGQFSSETTTAQPKSAGSSLDQRRTRTEGRILDADIPDSTAGSVARDAVSGLLQIGPTALKGVGDIARLATGDRIGKGLSDFADRGTKSIQEVVGSERGQLQRKRFEQDMTDPALSAGDVVLGNPGALVDMVAPTLGSMAIPIGAAGVAGRLATTGKGAQVARAIDEATVLARADKARQAAAIGATVAQNAGDTYGTIRDAGGTQDKAYLGAGISGAASAVMGKLTGGGAEGQIAKAMSGKTAKGGFASVGQAMAKEGVQEAGEEAGAYAGEMVGKDEAFDPNAAAKRLAVAGTLGAAMGGGVDVATHAATLRQDQARIKALQDSGEEDVAKVMQTQLDKKLSAFSVDTEISAISAKAEDLRTPDFEAHYRQLRGTGAKPIESAGRAAISSAYSSLAANAGIPPNALAAAIEAAKGKSIDQLPGFLHRYTVALAAKGLAQPGAEAQLMEALEDSRNRAIDVAIGAQSDVRSVMQSILELEGAQEAASVTEPITQGQNQNVQNAAPGVTETQSQAAPVEAPSDAGTAASAEAVPAATGGSAPVEAAGLKKPGPGGSLMPVKADLKTAKGLEVTLQREFSGKYNATIGGEPAGSVVYTDTPSGGFRVTGIDVDPKFRRKGVASAIYDFLEKDVTGQPLAESGGQSEDGIAFRRARASKVEAAGVTERKPARGSHLRTAANDKNPLIAFIAQHGLFHEKGKPNSLKAEFSPDKAIMVPGYPPVFRKTGQNLDLLTHRAIEDGFLPKDGTEQQLYGLIQRAIGGERIAPLHAEGVADDVGQKEMEARLKLEESNWDALREQDAQWNSEYDAERKAIELDAELTDAEFVASSDVIPLGVGSNADTSTFLRALGATEQEIQDAIAQESRIQKENNQLRPGPEKTPASQAPGNNGRIGQAPGDSPRNTEAVATPQTPADAGVSVSGVSIEPRADGTLAVSGPVAEIKAKLKAAGIPDKSVMPGKGKVIVGKTQADKAKAALQPTQDAAPVLQAPTPAEVIAQQDRKDNAQALDDKAQIDAEAQLQTLTAQVAPEQRTDTSGDMFAMEKAQAEIDKRNAGVESAKDPNQPGMFDEPAAVKDMEQYIKVAADSIEDLRKTDVFRVLVESNRSDLRNDIAEYIKSKRPDLVKEVNEVMAEQEQESAAKAQAAAPAVNPEAMRAKADLNNALADLADLLGKDFKANILPEQEQKLMPVLTRLFDAAFRLGYIKFKDAAKFALDQIRSALGNDVADAITLDHMQGAYIGMAGGKPGADTKRAVIDVETKSEIESHTAQVHNPAKETPDVPSPNTRVERNSGQPATEPAVGEPVPAEPGRLDQGTGQAGKDIGAEGRGRDGDTGVSVDSAVAGGERGGVFVHRGNEPGGAQSVDAGDMFGERGGDTGNDGIQADPIPASTVDQAAQASHGRSLQPNSVKVSPGLESIQATVPQLLPPQQEDVHKAETRFAKPTGYGMLFTNGTGTGKTFSGLGIVKRFALQGKTNTLITVPDDKIASDWIKSGRALGLDITKLADTKSSGTGVVITSYANLGANDELAKRNWDLVVADEAHSLMQAADGEVTGYLSNLRAITHHPDGVHQLHRMRNREDLNAAAYLSKQISVNERIANNDDTMDAMVDSLTSENAKLQKELSAIRKKLAERLEADKAEVASMQGAKRARAVFLSATPFAYEKTIDWANGYLFDYNEGYPYTETSLGYNDPTPREHFFMQHLAYRKRYGKLTEPDGSKVDRGLMQRQFNGWMKKEGSLSGRMLDVPADYDRRFVLVDSAIGNQIDEALQWLSDQSRAAPKEDGGYGALRAAIEDKFDYLSRRYLLEAIKATEVIPIVKAHMAMGRKVVVFHDYKKGGGFNPFSVQPSPPKDGADEFSATRAAQFNAALTAFRAKFTDLVNHPFHQMGSPIDVFNKAFDDVLLINGDEKKADLLKRYEEFQDDASGPKVMLVQSAKNKGWSGHDTTGKHQRVLINLGQPTAPTLAIQQEGRIYRTGQVSNAIMRYLNTGTNWEKWAFASTIAGRASTAENLGMGELSRALKDSFIASFEESDAYPPGHEGEGTGGKERDKANNAVITEWDRAKTFYWATGKKTSKTKAQEGTDYFATPEPVGLKMVEWLDLRGGEDAMEPSGGHGAIARWLPETTTRTVIEPSMALRSRLAMVMNDGDYKILDGIFENHNIVNKYDGIAMNPPFGVGGKTAMEHVAKAATHLRDGGRIVALIPTGPAADKRWEKWFYESEEKPNKPLMEHPTLGPIFKGDTVYVEGYGDIKFSATGKRAEYLEVKTQSYATYETLDRITKLDPTGKRAEEYKPAADLYLVADIKLPQVTFERAGTAVATRIVVLEKHAKESEAPQRSAARMDLSNAADINELFDRLENVALPTRPKAEVVAEPAKSEKPAKTIKQKAEVGSTITIDGKQYEISIFTTMAGKEKRGVWMKSKAEAQKYSARAFTSNAPKDAAHKGEWFVDEYWFPKTGTSDFDSSVAARDGDLLAQYTPEEAKAKQEREAQALKEEQAKPKAPPARRVTADQVDLFNPQGALFAKPPSRTGMSVKDARAVVDALTEKWDNAPEVRVVESFKDLPVDATPDTRGLYSRGTVWIVANANKDAFMVAKTYAHEAIAHHGLRSILGRNDWDKFMRQIQLAIASGNKPLNDISQDIRRVYVDENGRFNLPEGIEADEIAARVVENAIDQVTGHFRPGFGFVKEVYAKLAKWLREVVGIDVPFTMAELQGMLVAAQSGLKTGNRTVGGGQMVVAAEREDAQAARGTNAPVTNQKDVVGNQGGRSADDSTPGGYDEKEALGRDGQYRYQFQANTDGGQTIGNQMRVQKNADGSWSQYTAINGNPERLTRVRDDLSEVLPSDEAVAKGWAIPVKDFNDHKAVKHRTTSDSNKSTAPDSFGAPMAARQPPQQSLFQPNIWSTPDPTTMDKWIYEIQDAKVDLKRVQQAIAKAGNTIAEKWNARLAETLYPGRVAHRSQLFLDSEVKPLLSAMALNKMGMDELADYLHARGAPERNAQIAKVNPSMPDGGAGKNTKGVLMTNAAARAYIAAISPTRLMVLDAMAKRVDSITSGTRSLLVTEGLEKQSTIDAWNGAYQHYVPMFRDEADDGFPSHPQGSGFAVKGGASKRATGSTKEVTNILAHVLMQREAAITRAEKNRVAVSLYGLALSHPNPEFWTTIKPSMSAAAIGSELTAMGVDPMTAQIGMEGVPTVRTVDPNTGKVIDRLNPMYKSLPGAIPLKVNGEDRVLMLNTTNERGTRLAESLKNLDGLTQLDLAGSLVGKATRWLASVNTQYNPAFGLVNFTRDTLGGAVNLGSTELRGKSLKVLAGSIPAIWGVARELSTNGASGKWSALYRQFVEDGGQTGYMDNFRDPNERALAIEKEIKALGRAKLSPSRAAHFALDLLEGFNTTLENAVRVSAYSAALDQGVSREEAARLGRELTVDFNRKGRATREIGPLYAFFNASVQGGARTIQTINGPTGAKVIAGGLSLGVIQAIMLAMAGYDDDEIPESVKTRSLIIPMNWTGAGDKKHILIPYQLGLHVIPNTGRVLSELALNGGKDIGKRSVDAVGEIASAFNPLGGGNILTADGALKTVAPTVVDPLIELGFNRNFAGSPIEKQSFGGESDNRPGVARVKESTQKKLTGQAYISISKALNWASLGTEYEAGLVSPTPERVQYIAQVVGGGVLREFEKSINAADLASRGEKVKPNAIPALGKFYGEVDRDQVDVSRYYESARKIKAAESSIKAMKKAGDDAALDKFEKDHPEATLIREFNRVQRGVSALNREAVQTIGNPAEMKQIEADRLEIMRDLNLSVKELEQESGKTTLADKLKPSKAMKVAEAQ